MATIDNRTEETLISGTSGNDSIKNWERDVTINAGNGNDTLALEYHGDPIKDEIIQYAEGDGNDVVIVNIGETEYHEPADSANFSGLIDITSGSVSSYSVDGYTHVFKIGTGSITLNNIKTAQYDEDNVSYSDDNIVVRTKVNGANKYTRYFFGKGFVDPNYDNEDGDYYYFEKDTLLSGTSGNDYIEYDNLGFTTIDGGKGDDYIEISRNGDVINYANGDGNDIIKDSSSATLNITNGEITDITNNDHDLIIKFGSGSLRMLDSVKYGRYKSSYSENYYSTSKIMLGDAVYSLNANTASDDILYISEYSGSSLNSEDSITLNGGNDTIYGYEGQRIYLASSTALSASLNGSDLKVTTNDGSLTIRNISNAKDEYIHIINSDEGHLSYLYDGTKLVNVKSNLIGKYNEQLNGTSGADHIYNETWETTIDAAAGNDYIYNVSRNVSISGGTDNDTIVTSADEATIHYDSGDGKDIVSVNGSSYDNLTFEFGAEISDYTAAGDEHTIKVGSGSMVLHDVNPSTTVDKITVKTPSGMKKYINGQKFNYADEGTDADDYIYKTGFSGEEEDHYTLSGFSGSDYIDINLRNSDMGGDFSEIFGDTGNDTIITNDFIRSTIDGGAGNDLIQVIGGSYNYYDESKYEDVQSGSAHLSVAGGAGNDVIELEQTSTTTRGGTAEYGAGSFDEHFGPWSDTISSTETVGKQITVNGGTGNDTIRNAFINTPENYTLINSEGHTITSTLNNDTLIKLETNGNHTVTIQSSLIYSRLIQYADGDGDDLVEDYRVGDTIQVTEGTIDSKTANGVDVVVKIGSGSITLKNAANKELTFINADGTTTKDTVKAEVDVPKGLTYNETWTAVTVDSKYGSKLNSSDYLSSVIAIDASNRGKAINIIGNSNYNSIFGSTKNDTLQGGDGDDTLVSGKGKDTLVGGAGNDVFVYANGDGNDVITDFQTGDSIKLTDSELSKVTTSTKNTNVVLTIGKGKVTLKGAKDESIIVNHADGSISTLSGDGKVNAITNDISNVTVTGGTFNDSIHNYAEGSNATILGGAGNDTIDNYAVNILLEGEAGNDYINNHSNRSTINGGAGNDTISLNASQYSTVVAGAGNDSIVVGTSSNNTINGGAGDDTIKLDSNSSNNIIQYNNGDGKDVIADYVEGVATIQVLGNTISKVANGGKNAENDVVFTVGKGSITVKDGAGKAITLIDKDGKTTTQAYAASTITITDSMSDTIDVSKDSTVLEVNASPRSKGVDIIGNSKANTLKGGAGNDVLTGGSGKDVFVYSGGNDTITDYKSGTDMIQLSGKNYSSVKYVGESETDLCLTFSDGGTLTIENVAPVKSVGGKLKKQYPQKVTIINSDGINTGAQIYGSEYASTIDVANSDGDSILANSAVDYINGKKRSKAVTLIGNSTKDNTIVGGSKADTIRGFSGNNVLTGNGGKDVFIINATSGSDTITDYTAKQDSIIATSAYSTYSVEGKDVIFSFSNTANILTVKNGKNKVVTLNNVNYTCEDIHELVLTSSDNNKTFDLTNNNYAQITKVDASKTTKSVTLIANSSGNSIIGGKDADTITLGAGKDTVVYMSGYGNDTIKNYSAENDIIQLGNNTRIDKASVVEVKDADGNVTHANYVFTIGKNKLTVESGATKTVTFFDDDGNEMNFNAHYTLPTNNSAAFEERGYNELFADDNYETSELSTILTKDIEIAIKQDSAADIGLNKNEFVPALASTEDKEK